MKTELPTEQQEAEIFSAWLALNGIKHHHGNDNMYSTSWGQKHKMKSAGFSRGFPDFLVVTPQGLCFIELKRKKRGIISPEQKEWIDILQKLWGIEARVCIGADEAIEMVKEFL